jgi:hypothetical protein
MKDDQKVKTKYFSICINFPFPLVTYGRIYSIHHSVRSVPNSIMNENLMELTTKGKQLVT